MMPDLSELIARVEGLEGANFEAEVEIARALEPERLHWKQTPPNYTASLDAALALVTRVLPGWGWMMLNEPSHCENGCSYAGLTPPDGSRAPSIALPGKPPALALILALLRAVAVKEKDRGE